MSNKNNSKLLDFYKDMLRIREFEKEVAHLSENGKIVGFLHMCSGQEAVYVGAIKNNLKERDWIVNTHRSHGVLIARDVSTKKIMAELLAKKSGTCKGRVGSTYLMDYKSKIVGHNGILGAGSVIGDGLSLASKLDNDQDPPVTICFLGAGEMNEGAVHESMNLSSTWNLPIVYIVLNNNYAISTSPENSTPIENMADRAKGFDIPSVVVDGMDVFEVENKVKEAVESVRNGNGPKLLECRTYSYMGSFLGDPLLEERKGELRRWESKDPIKMVERMLDKEEIDPAKLEQIRSEVEEEIKEAAEFAENSESPTEESIEDFPFLEE